MAIIRFTSNPKEIPFFAVNVKASHALSHYGNDVMGPRALWTYETHSGFCIRDFERNSYDDSDFIMTVWNPFAGKAENIEFASTRGWSYPSYGSKADATLEVMTAFNAWVAANDRRRRILNKLAIRQKRIKLARAIGETNYRRILKLENVVPAGKWSNLEALMFCNLRSTFRKSLKQQILNWYFDASPKYPNPLSSKQWDYV